jgi:hypothetical protein
MAKSVARVDIAYSLLLHLFIFYPLVKRVGYMFHYVCLCVCVSVCVSVCGLNISGSTVAIDLNFCMQVAFGILVSIPALHTNASLVRPGVGENPFPVFTPPPFKGL